MSPICCTPDQEPAVERGSELSTVTGTPADTVALPEVSRARAVSACGPARAGLGLEATAYGAVRSSAPRLARPRRNWPAAPPRSSAGVAPPWTVPLTVAPAAGAEIA